MKKFTISVAVASIFAGSLFAGDHGMMKMDKEECFKMHKEFHSQDLKKEEVKNLSASEKALLYIQTKYGKQDDIREY